MESLSSNFEEIGMEIDGISGVNIGGGMDLDTVYAGFPSPAEEFMEKKLDLNELIIKHPVSTFMARVRGDSMDGVGVYSGDILVVDRAIKPRENHIVVAVIDQQFYVKRLRIKNGQLYLLAENTMYAPLRIKNEDSLSIWGVVTTVIKPLL